MGGILVVIDAGLAQVADTGALMLLSESSINISHGGVEPFAIRPVCRILVESAEVPFENALVL